MIYNIIFYKNGKYRVKVGNKTLKGIWSRKDNILTVKIDNKITKYGFAFNKGYLVLAQSKTNYMVLGKNKKFFKQYIKKMQKDAPSVNYNKGVLTDKQFLYLLKNYATMNPNIVYNYLTRLNKNQKSWVPIYQAWFGLMVFRACQGDAAYKNNTDSQMCAKSKKDYQFMVQNNSLGGDVWSYGKSQTSKLIASYERKAGNVSNSDWKLRMKGQQMINNSTNQNWKTISDGFKPLPCTEHYEQGTNVYLGCY